MCAPLQTRSVGAGRQHSRRFRKPRIVLATLALPLMLSACVQTPPAVLAGPDPSNPRAQVRPVTYRSTVAGYTSWRPVEPRPWTQQNQRLAPAESP